MPVISQIRSFEKRDAVELAVKTLESRARGRRELEPLPFGAAFLQSYGISLNIRVKLNAGLERLLLPELT